jgi:hypothetical protein
MPQLGTQLNGKRSKRGRLSEGVLAPKKRTRDYMLVTVSDSLRTRKKLAERSDTTLEFSLYFSLFCLPFLSKELFSFSFV